MVAHYDIGLVWVEVFCSLHLYAHQGQREKKPGVNVMAKPDDVFPPTSREQQKGQIVKREEHQPKQEEDEEGIDGPGFS